MQPCTWEVRLAGFRIGPHSKASQTSCTLISPFLRSMPTSTHAATTEFFSVPQASPTPSSGVTFFRRSDQLNCFAAVSRTVPDARIVKVSQPELQRVGPRRRGQLVHERLAREVVARRRQTPVRPLGQRRIGADGLGPLVRDLVGRINGRAAGVDVREVPGDQRAFGVETALALDDRRRPEIGPGELLGPRPAHADRLARPPWPGGPLPVRPARRACRRIRRPCPAR